MKRRILILGAAGRDFHNFNVRYRHDPTIQVVAFTATQIPNIAGRVYPAELAGPQYPYGIPIDLEENLEELIREQEIEQVVFSYSDVSHNHVMDLASRATAAGADFALLSAESTMLRSRVPVVSVCAVRTGCGKSPVSRRVVQILRKLGCTPVIVRHPMPYGDLARQRVQRFGSLSDLQEQHCTVEEREEYEPHLLHGTVVYAGVDYEEILRRAEREAGVIVWDGGNNDTPFFRPSLEIVVADPLRAGHELLYYPGEVNLLRANVVVINKVNTATEQGIEKVRRNVRERNPHAQIVEAALRITVNDPERILGARVLVIEDGPTLTHGGMAYGAGMVAAHENGAGDFVDPRPYAVGSLKDVFARYPHIGSLLPAMGYSPKQLDELEKTIWNTPCDVIVEATPAHLDRLIELPVPVVRVGYEMVEHGEWVLEEILRDAVAEREPLFA
ncbi:MAG: GTPase [Acidobacteria bacterium]|nr:GTPase [Acidobacteriota bacterium]